VKGKTEKKKTIFQNYFTC